MTARLFGHPAFRTVRVFFLSALVTVYRFLSIIMTFLYFNKLSDSFFTNEKRDPTVVFTTTKHLCFASPTVAFNWRFNRCFNHFLQALTPVSLARYALQK